MNIKEVGFCSLVLLAAVFIYYPVFSADYLYSDEATQLWLNARQLNFGTSIPQGRFLSYKIFEWVFSYIHTISSVSYARIFSFAGWGICLPVWYFIISKLIKANGLPTVLGLLSMVYLVTMPPFAIYIGWAACMQIFIACTSGLVSGYILYSAIKIQSGTATVSSFSMLLSVFFGLISLFTYQNGFGCFFIPFFMHFISVKHFNKNVLIGLIFPLVISIIYYFLFKYSLKSTALPISDRASLSTDIAAKLVFLFTKPLAAAFHFTFLFNEKSTTGIVCYVVVAVVWLVAFFRRNSPNGSSKKLSYLFGVLGFFILIYLPSLIVKENYSSNRTLFALDFAVFLLIGESLFSGIKKSVFKTTGAAIPGVLFLVTGWYNFNIQFLNPVVAEFKVLNTFVRKHYNPQIKQVYFICPEENTFEIKYKITASWDEFGVPSTAKIWVPEPLIKQLVYEITGNHALADSVLVKTWQNKTEFENSGVKIPENVLLINMQEILEK